MPNFGSSRLRRPLGALLAVAMVATACGLSENDLEAAQSTPSTDAASPPGEQGTDSQDAEGSENGAEDAGTDDAGEDDLAGTDPTGTTVAPEDRGPLDERPTTGSLAGLDDRYYPLLGNRGYDVASYDISLEWAEETGAIDALTVITATASQDLDLFHLDYRGPEISSVLVDGTQADFASEDPHELIVTPPNAVDDGSEFVVEVAYAGVPQAIAGPFGEALGWQTINDTVTVVSEPDGASTWFPANDHPLDKAQYTITVEVPVDFSVASNGLLAGVTESDDGTTHTWEWATVEPMASYLATVNIGQFRVIEGKSESGVPIRSYTATEDEVILRELEYLPQMMDELEDLFGPYPLEAYGAVVLPTGLGFALETQTMSVFGTDTARIRRIHVHELAHQWFGNSVSPAEWDDVWLNEGFASYAEALWQEAIVDSYDIDGDMEAQANFARESLGPPADPGADTLFDPSVYTRGALVLHALRLTIGDEAFFSFVDAWISENRNSNASTAEFMETAQRFSDNDLSTFFQQWIFGEEIPELPGS